MNDDQELLRQYCEQNSETAFRALVERYVNLVYSAAFRKTDDAHLARDASQIVFIDLARKARRLSSNVVLAGWLYRSACFAAAKLVRSECRRMAREKVSMNVNSPSTAMESDWTHIRPVLDDALNSLGEKDRDAVVLRFFESKAWREVGSALGISEDAAQKRVNRALEKLREMLARNGTVLSAASLASLLTVNAVQSAPAGLSAAIAVAGIGSVSVGGSVAFLELMASSKIKIAAVCALAAAFFIPVGLQHRTVKRLRAEAQQLREELRPLNELRMENQRLAKISVDAAQMERLRASQSELLRLRGEVTLLRNEKAEWLRQQPASPPPDATPLQARIELKGRYIRREQWTDRGIGDAQNAFHTVMRALANRDEKRLKECTFDFYQPENVTPRVVDSSMTALLPIRIDSVAGYQVISSSSGGDPVKEEPGAVHWVSFVLQKEFQAKDKDGKPLTQQLVEKWPFERTETGEFKWIPEARAFEKLYSVPRQGNTVAPIK